MIDLSKAKLVKSCSPSGDQHFWTLGLILKSEATIDYRTLQQISDERPITDDLKRELWLSCYGDLMAAVMDYMATARQFMCTQPGWPMHAESIERKEKAVCDLLKTP